MSQAFSVLLLLQIIKKKSNCYPVGEVKEAQAMSAEEPAVQQEKKETETYWTNANVDIKLVAGFHNQLTQI